MIVTARVAEGGFQKLDIVSSDTKEAFDIGVLPMVIAIPGFSSISERRRSLSSSTTASSINTLLAFVMPA